MTSIGEIVSLYPDRNYGIVKSCRHPDNRATFLLKDQRALDERGNINPEEKGTIKPEEGLIVRLKIDRDRIVIGGEMVYLWAVEGDIIKTKNPGSGKNKRRQTRFYSQPDRRQEPSNIGGTAVEEQKPVPVITQVSVPELPNAEISITKDQCSSGIQRKATTDNQQKKLLPFQQKTVKEMNFSGEGYKRKVDGKKRPPKRGKDKSRDAYGHNFRGLAHDVGANPIPDRTPKKIQHKFIAEVTQSLVPENSGAEISAEKIQNQKTVHNAAQANQPGVFIQETARLPQKAAQVSNRVLPEWIVEEGLDLMQNGGKIQLGVARS